MKLQYFNNLRATACFLVILTHSAMPALDQSFGIYMVLFSIISSPSSELFVTISSSLLAPSKLNMFDFYKKRFKKLIPPFLFWSIIILIIGLFKTDFDFNLFLKKVLLFPIVPVTGVYWFVYAISGLYFVIPLISPWLEQAKKTELLFIISIWVITLLLPYLNIITGEDIYNINGDYYFILNYLGGFIGYLFLGVYLRRHPIVFNKRIYFYLTTILLITLGLIPFIYGYFFNRSSLSLIADNLSLSSTFFVSAIFILFQNIKLPSVVEYSFNTIAKYSYGIYLIHIIVVRDIVWRFFENNRLPHPILETPVIALVSLIICILIVKVISFLPKSNYIVGL